MARAFLDEHIFCARCHGFAELAHHKVPHEGDPALFYDVNNLEPLCRSCHEYEHRRGATAR
jgi:5-methylcytosine-specific restriction protein A